MSAIGPVSNPGRTMMASLQQAISKGMPPDQAIAYVKSMATAGLAPLADLYSMMKQFERLKQPTALPPQGGTIKDQLNQAMAQKQMAQQGQMQDPRMAQQMPQQSQMPQDTQQGLSAIQAARGGLMYASPMERGLGGLDAGSMNDAQYAAGGIVAFADGSPAGVVDRWAQKDADRYKELTDFRNKVNLQYMPIGMGPGEIGTFYSNPDEGAARLFDQTDDEFNKLKQRSQAIGQRQLLEKQEQDRASQIAAAASRLGVTPSPDPVKPPPVTNKVNSGANVPPGTKSVNTPRGPSVGGDLSINSIFGRMNKQLSAAELEAKKTPADLVKEREDYFKLKGLDTTEAARAARLTGREKEVKDQISQDKKMSLAEAGFAMAQAAGLRGRDRVGLLGAAAAGGQKYAASTKQANKENRALTVAIQDQQDALATATELRKRGEYDKANDVTNIARARVDTLTGNMTTAQIQVVLKRMSEEGENSRAGMALLAQQAQDKRAREDKLILSKTYNDLLVARTEALRGKDPDIVKQNVAAIDNRLNSLREQFGVSGAGGRSEINYDDLGSK